MPKVYDEKPRNDELFLRLWQDGGKVELDMVDDMGRWQAVLARIDGNGLHLAGGADPRCAARAGMANAFDANGRIKIANQSVKERYADEMHGALKHLVEEPMWAATVGNAKALLAEIEAEENGDG